MKTKLDPKTLRWCARKLRADQREALALAADEKRGHVRGELRHWACAVATHADDFLDRARKLEKRT